ncbi:MAG: MazG family protein [Planctomycetota bacterium]|nr:MazG family protein [Planctomycetota bacterium]
MTGANSPGETAPGRGLPQPVPVDDPRIDGLRLLLGTVDRLREEDGCPWDREQTLASMGPHLVEEALELVEAVEAAGADSASASQVDHMAEETGDALMVLLLMARIGSETRQFDLVDVTSAICAKLIRRHPHVFGEEAAASPGEALERWEAVKRQERAERADGTGEETDTSALAGVPRGLPALQRARRLCTKAVAAGFAWPSVAGALAKVEEELGELQEALPPAALDRPALSAPPAQAAEAVSHELGDLMLAGAFLAAYLDLDPEALCRRALRRVDDRVRTMEQELGGELGGRDLETLLAAYGRAKA